MGANFETERAASLTRQIMEYAGKLAHQEAKIMGLKEQIAAANEENITLRETIRGIEGFDKIKAKRK